MPKSEDTNPLQTHVDSDDGFSDVENDLEGSAILHNSAPTSANQSLTKTVLFGAGMLVCGILMGSICVQLSHPSAGSSRDLSPPLPASNNSMSLQGKNYSPTEETIVGPEDLSLGDEDHVEEPPPQFPTEPKNQNLKQKNAAPSLAELVKDEEIQGDVSWLLDFAIVDFAKCGTTFLMHYLGKSSEVNINKGEICYMSDDRPQDVVKRFYEESRKTSSTTEHLRNGLKCPHDLESEIGIVNYKQYFPDTDFIISMRHPVQWFESYYNYEAYNLWPAPMSPPDELVGPCVEGSPYVRTKGSQLGKKVCTNRANFHHTLSRLGKTPMKDHREKKLLNHNMTIVPTKNRVFIMTLDQADPANGVSEQLSEDLRDFLRLKTDLPKLPSHGSSWRPPARNLKDYSITERREFLINICDSKHSQIRSGLMEIGRHASDWIREYFLESPDVHVSSRDYFIQSIKQWALDPCDIE